MVQFYVLTIILNILAGYALLSYNVEAKGTHTDHIREFLKNGTTRLVLGILCLTVGFFKLLTVMRGDIPVVGDLFPAAAGMIAGFTLLLEYYRTTSSVMSETLQKLDKIFVTNRRIVGIAAVLSGFLHFLFANVLLL